MRPSCGLRGGTADGRNRGENKKAVPGLEAPEPLGKCRVYGWAERYCS